MEKINFYPRSPCGERHNVVSKTVPAGEISIHALLAESDDIGNLTIEGFFISIHALLAESDGKSTTLTRIAWISIHALLAESDCPASWFDLWGWKISIHALLAESDVEKVPADVFYQAFLSTLSLRRATTLPQKAVTTRGFLSTLSLRRATHGFLRGLPKEHLFLSTLSLRRATP